MARSTRERRDTVLRAIVADYVHSGEPVGSKALVDKHDLGVSPATVRNDMSALEEEGYIYQPHTSAGRIPTEKGYRAFVDQIAQLKPLSAPERHAIETFLTGAVDVDDLVDRTVRLLAQLTHQLAVVQYPRFSRSCVRHLELVPLARTRILLVIITNSGSVEQRSVDVEEELDDRDIETLRVLLNALVAGLELGELATVSLAACGVSAQLRGVASQVLRIVAETLGEETDSRVVIAGTANLVRAGEDFSGSLGPVLDALEEQVALLRLFAEAEAQPDSGVSVTIGTENHHAAFLETALVSGTYDSAGGSLAHLGVIGPTRMDYASTMTTVGAVARYLSHFLTR
ncbi:MAG: heat-inducible transcriptional repressor HrcA [Actinomycetaceae bacterium]|nr:heat-inducible transcriptional repressor HrcA [Actinomycetaceae bacterium]